MSAFKPYFAVIFTSTQSATEGYAEMAQEMADLASTQPGYLGMDSAKNEVGITVSYWESLEAIKSWKLHSEHLLAQKLGKSQWYDWYKIRICKVQHEYEFDSKLF
jgi:heme-degrading monooxygenase HmoA